MGKLYILKGTLLLNLYYKTGGRQKFPNYVVYVAPDDLIPLYRDIIPVVCVLLKARVKLPLWHRSCVQIRIK